MLQSRMQSRMRVEEQSQVGACRRAALQLAESHQFDVTLAGRAGIIATELANNLLRHASRGEILLQALEDGSRVTIEIVAIDTGPGMQVERCMRDGFSTGGTAGTGLGAISRLSNFFDIYSIAGQGTVVVSRICAPTPARAPRGTADTPEIGAICIALAGEIECGDCWRVAEDGEFRSIMIADGLGHGPLAAIPARSAAEAFGEKPFDAPTGILQRMHERLGGSRGAAAACAVLNAATSTVAYSGVGNICGVVVSREQAKGMVSHNGIVGVQQLRKQQFDYAYDAGSRVIMHSDGMSARWSLGDYPGLFARHPAVIAAVLYRDHARPRDDVTVIVSGERR